MLWNISDRFLSNSVGCNTGMSLYQEQNWCEHGEEMRMRQEGFRDTFGFVLFYYNDVAT